MNKYTAITLALFGLLSCALAYEKFDLSPQDVSALCKVVTGSDVPEPPSCIYYKWVMCPDDPGTPDRPCGWYEQTPCDAAPAGRSAKKGKGAKAGKGLKAGKGVKAGKGATKAGKGVKAGKGATSKAGKGIKAGKGATSKAGKGIKAGKGVKAGKGIKGKGATGRRKRSALLDLEDHESRFETEMESNVESAFLTWPDLSRK